MEYLQMFLLLLQDPPATASSQSAKYTPFIPSGIQDQFDTTMIRASSFPQLPVKHESPKPEKPERKLRPDVNLDFLLNPSKATSKPNSASSTVPATLSATSEDSPEVVTKFMDDVLKSVPKTEPCTYHAKSETALAMEAIKSEAKNSLTPPPAAYPVDTLQPMTSYPDDEAATAAAGILAEDETRLSSLPATIPDFNNCYSQVTIMILYQDFRH